MPPTADDQGTPSTAGLGRKPRVWRGLLVGLGAGAFYGIQAGVNRSSVLFGLLDGGFWASLFFFLFARPSVWRLSKPPATYKQLSRPERAVVRRAYRNGVVPEDAALQSSAVDLAQWRATLKTDPDAFVTAQLWVMVGWTGLFVAFAILRLATGEWARSVGNAAFAFLPALIATAIVTDRRLRSCAHRYLTLPAVKRDTDDPESGR